MSSIISPRYCLKYLGEIKNLSQSCLELFVHPYYHLKKLILNTDSKVNLLVVLFGEFTRLFFEHYKFVFSFFHQCC